jgi:hypothetical protein
MSCEGKRHRTGSSGLLETLNPLIFVLILSISLRNFSNSSGHKSDTLLYTWEFVRGERDVDVRTSAIKNNLEFITDMCERFGLDVNLFLGCLGDKRNHIYRATRINIRTVYKTAFRNAFVVDCVCVCVCVCVCIYIYIQGYS